MDRSFSTCWIITDGHTGGLNQCMGLAEALGFSPIVKHVALRAPWRQLSPYFRLGQAHALTGDSDKLLPPWPDLVIASGRQSIAAALYVRTQGRRAGRNTVAVFIQNPGISPKHFDLVIAPEHDRVRGANVVSTRGALHHITAAKLNQGAAQFAPRIADLPRPYIGVLIGGSNASYSLGETEVVRLAESLKKAASATGGSLLVTPSRRTGEANVALLKSVLSDTRSFVWDGSGDNPYFGLLALSDYLVVTNDSVSMVSEAVASGTPTYVFALPGKSQKFARFHEGMLRQGWTRIFDGVLEPFDRPAAEDETALAARAVRPLIARAG
ncbi:MAG: mitochondrial fission ELM1 family protein [Rhizomicrobium sp.]